MKEGLWKSSLEKEGKKIGNEGGRDTGMRWFEGKEGGCGRREESQGDIGSVGGM